MGVLMVVVVLGGGIVMFNFAGKGSLGSSAGSSEPPHIRKLVLRKKMKCIKGAQNSRSVLGTQTVGLGPETAPPPPVSVTVATKPRPGPRPAHSVGGGILRVADLHGAAAGAGRGHGGPWGQGCCSGEQWGLASPCHPHPPCVATLTPDTRKRWVARKPEHSGGIARQPNASGGRGAGGLGSAGPIPAPKAPGSDPGHGTTA